ncbi:MAG TPA: preprotein translocase subunit SecY [Candidatus Fimenecus excrementigallinarum]|uniref:Protein translocase subunit SecY n=1 Tax=Candidatus Fimenecus excrementigallinarum TaxID=2840816 RepID=A0A9D1IH73_9FIRM|nr:preprotein translocase subunit SecY [Candidatus Fimenecus excrementigallinarum]
MLQTFVNAWKIADLRKKMLYTALIILIFRIGAALPVPFTDLADGLITDPDANNFMAYLSMMTGDAFNYGTLFAMSITPYINASIIIQLLTVAIPALERLAKEGEEGRKKLSAITRYSAVALAALQSTAYYFFIRAQGYLSVSADGAAYTGFFAVFQALVVILCYTAGATLLMWLGEQINEKGIGNGISIILFAGIVSRMPTTLYNLWSYVNRGGAYIPLAIIAIVSMLLMIAFIVWMDNAERRIPVQYAKRVVGRKMYGGQNTHIPIKVNMCGVLPVIFASSILSLPPTIQMFVTLNPDESGWDAFWQGFFNIFQTTHWAYVIMYFLLIIFFAYFYAAIQYNPIEMANNIRRNSGAIPGIRPGKPTSDYIAKILHKITLLGALLLSVVALYPLLFSQITALFDKQVNLTMGGTSVIIMVGVALETVKQLESQMMMRHYKGFLD